MHIITQVSNFDWNTLIYKASITDAMSFEIQRGQNFSSGSLSSTELTYRKTSEGFSRKSSEIRAGFKYIL